MNERLMPMELTDGLIERMLVQRAGPGAPSDLVASVVATADRTSQRRQAILAGLSVPTTARTRLAWFALAFALVILAIGIALAGAALLHRPGPFGLGLATFASNGDVFVEYADGSDRRQLTSTPALDFSPTFSPDGSKIAYLSQAEPGDPGGGPGKTAATSLLVVNVDGSGDRALADGLFYVFSVGWSPDSAHIAYRHEVPTPSGSGTAIGVVGLDGSPPVTLLADGDDPQWSPDGGTIAYTSGDGVHLASADGAASQLISPGRSPRWSPDGSRLAYSTLRCCGPIPDTWVVDRDGSDAHPITHGAGNEVFGGWSNDGSSTLISRTLADGSREITVADADGSNGRNISVPGATGDPSWAPDGTRLFVPSATGMLLVDPTGAVGPVAIPIDAAQWVSWQPLSHPRAAEGSTSGSAPLATSALAAPPPRRSTDGFSLPFSFDASVFDSEDRDQWAVSPHAYVMLYRSGPDHDGAAAYANARLYADPCHPARGFADSGSTPGGLAAALAAVPGFAVDASEPITVDGFGGVRIRFHPTTDAVGCDPPGALSLLEADPQVDELVVFPRFTEAGQNGFGCCFLPHRRSGSVDTAPGSVSITWEIVDVHGTRLILEAWTAVFPNGSPIGSMLELQEVLDSIRFE